MLNKVFNYYLFILRVCDWNLSSGFNSLICHILMWNSETDAWSYEFEVDSFSLGLGFLSPPFHSLLLSFLPLFLLIMEVIMNSEWLCLNRLINDWLIHCFLWGPTFHKSNRWIIVLKRNSLFRILPLFLINECSSFMCHLNCWNMRLQQKKEAISIHSSLENTYGSITKCWFFRKKNYFSHPVCFFQHHLAKVQIISLGICWTTLLLPRVHPSRDMNFLNLCLLTSFLPLVSVTGW